MNEYRHHLSGFFAHRDDAKKALSRLAEQGLHRDRLNIFTADSVQPVSSQEKKSAGNRDGAGSHPGIGRNQQGINIVPT